LADRGESKRRSYSKAFKRRIVAETLEPGASVAAVARQHGLNANMFFKWLRDPRFMLSADERPSFLPVEVLQDASPSAAMANGDPDWPYGRESTILNGAAGHKRRGWISEREFQARFSRRK